MASGTNPQLLVYGLRVWGLPVMDRNGKADPYLKLKVGSETFGTRAKKATLEANWDEQFYFGKKDRRGQLMGQDSLVIHVWDDDMFRDELVGQVTIDLLDIKDRSNPTKTVTQDILGKDGEACGQLSASLLFVNLPVTAAGAEGGAATAAAAAASAAPGAPPPPPAAAAASAAAAAAVAELANNTLRFRVFGVRGLKDKFDTYLRVDSSTGGARTPVVASSSEPVFDASYLCPAPSAASTVVITVLRKNRVFRDGFLGAIALTAGDFEGTRPRRQWYSLGAREGVEGDGTRGEIEILVDWESSLSPVAAPVPFDPSTGEARIGTPTADGQTGEVVPPEAKAESDEEAAAKEDADRRRRAMLEGMALRKGDYKVMVHVHEVRQLKDEDMNNSVDPCVRVEVMGQRQQTKTAWMTNSVVFDHLMYFSFKDLEPEQLETGAVAVRVFDVDRFSRDDLVGQYLLDLPFVYFREHHELHMQWLGLTDPTDRRKKGLMGYVKVSVCVLGPDDRRHFWDPAEEARLEAAERERGLESVVMMPPSIDRKTEFLVVTAHRAEDLMPMDTPQVGGLLKGGIDAYVQVDFAGNPSARTPWVAKKVRRGEPLNVSWGSKNQLWIPVMVPTMTTAVRCSVMDFDLATRDDLVGTFYLDFRQLRQEPVHRRWFNLYGAPEGVMNAEADAMNTFPAAATHYRGRVLLTAEVVRHPGDGEVEHVHAKSSQVPVFLDPAYELSALAQGPGHSASASEASTTPPRSPLGEASEPETREYTLRALVVAGADVPAKFNPLSRRLGAAKGHEMSVEFAVGPNLVFTKGKLVSNGSVWWGEQLSARVRLPADPEQVPDVFMYLRRGKDGARVCYARWSGADLSQEEDAFVGATNPCEWVPLREDAALDALAGNQQAGAVLCRVALAPSDDEAEDVTWEDDLERAAEKASFELRVHVYQARNLPSADSSGSADPYVRVQVDGQTAETRHKRSTVSPMWYETLRFRDLALPASAEFRPPVTVQVFDWDRYTSDDFISELRLPLGDPRVMVHSFGQDGSSELPDELPDPEWYPLTALGREDDGPQGELLVSFQLVRYPGIPPGRPPTVAAPRPASIVPDMRRWNIEVLCLGIRGLSGFMGLPVANPRVDIDLGDRSKAEAVKSTRHSNFPSGSDPNFCQRIVIPCRLPRREIFAPAINLTVVDRRLGGYLSPVVGTATVALVDKIPGTSSYRPPFGSEQTENLHFRDMSEAEKASPPVFPKSARASAKPARASRLVTASAPLRSAGDAVMPLELDGIPLDASGAASPAASVAASSTSRPRRRQMAVPESHGASAAAVRAAAAAEEAKAASSSGVGAAAATAEARAAASLERETARSRASSAARSAGDVSLERPTEATREAAAGGAGSLIEIDGVAAAPSRAAVSPLLSLGRAEAPLAGADVRQARGAARAGVAAQGVIARGGPRPPRAPNTLRAAPAAEGSQASAAAAEAEAAGIDVSFLSRHLKRADGAVMADGTARFHPEDKAAKYMSHRRVYERGMEEALQTAPFETISIMRGQDVGRGHIFGWKLPSTKRRVGVFKGIVRVIADADDEPPAGWAKILEPKEYEVRAYVLEGRGMRPMDRNRRSDCYLRAELGRDRQSFRSDYVARSIDPPLYKVVTFKTTLPGPSRLELSVWDYDSVTFDDFIGRTVIDLEDRWFDPRWQALGAGFETPGRLAPKPLEERRLFTQDRWESTGMLQVWVDILEPAKAREYPAVDIEPPPPRDFECRVVVWRTWGVPAHDYFTDMNDLYVRGWLEGAQAQSTDVHLRCKRGRGSFNWRMVFPTTVPCKSPVLHLQMWDRDYLKVSDLIAQTALNLTEHFAAARHYRGRYMVMDSIREAFEGAWGMDSESDAGSDAGDGDAGPGAAGLAVPGPAGAAAAAGGGRGGGAGQEGAALLAEGDDAAGPGGQESVVVPVLSSAVAAAEKAEADAVQRTKRERRQARAAAKGPAAAAEAKRRAEAAKGKTQAEFLAAEPADAKAGSSEGAALLGATKAAEDKEQAEAAASTVRQAKEAVGVPVHPHAENAAWLPMYQHYGKDDDGNKVMLRQPEYMGKVLVSVELVPKDVAESIPVGRGRSAPNDHPALPEPAGRMRFSLNPFYLGQECLGPRIFGNCLLCLCLVLGVVAVFFGAPFIDAIASIISALGAPIGGILGGLLLAFFLVPLIYVCVRYIWCAGRLGVVSEAATDNHTYLDLMQVQTAKHDASAFGFGLDDASGADGAAGTGTGAAGAPAQPKPGAAGVSRPGAAADAKPLRPHQDLRDAAAHSAVADSPPSADHLRSALKPASQRE